MAELLIDAYPEIVKEWHPTKNDGVNVKDILANTTRSYWWQCSVNPKHEWRTRVNTRTRYGSGCPYCDGKKVLPEESFAALYPDIAAEFHHTKNNDIDPYRLAPGSNKKVWWKCSHNPKHEWRTSIVSRTTNGTGCRQCLRLSNSLAKAFPKIAKEWHPTKNAGLTPSDVPGKTRTKVWWQCSVNPSHEWEMSIEARTTAWGSCPHCRKLQGHKKLPTIREFSEKLTAEWHPTKNGKFTPDNVSVGSGKKIWWICSKDHTHVWPAQVRNRAQKNQGCPFCTNIAVDESNSLATLFPEIAKEWHPTKNGTLTPDMVSRGSAKRIWWQCLKNPDHVWDASVDSRTHNQSGCPYCSGFFPNETNSLQAKAPEIAKEWHPTKNGELTPETVKAGSGKKAWWQCPQNPEHEWLATINNRVQKRSGCPYCNREKASQELSDALVDSVRSNTDFYTTFTESIDNLKELLHIALNNKRLYQPFLRMIYANTIAIMETYLSDAFVQTVVNNQQYITNLLQTDPEFKDRKYGLSEILVWEEFSKKTVTKYLLNNIMWHNIFRVAKMYEAVLHINFPNDDDLAPVSKAVAVRHDIVHRNGKDKQGTVRKFDIRGVEKNIATISAFITHIDKQLHTIRKKNSGE